MVNRIKKAYNCFTIVFALFTTVAAQEDIKSVMSPDVIFQTLALNRDLPTAAKPKYLSPTDLVPSPDKTKLFVVEQTAKQIAVVSIPGNTVILTIKLPNEVTGVAVSKNGSRLYATCSSELWPEGYVYEIDASSGKILRSIKVGHSSRSPVLSPDGNTLYVCNQFNNDISVVNVAAGRETRRIKVVREPYVARITPDGSILAVANSLPAGKATDTLKFSSEISLIDLNDTSKSVNTPLTLGSNSVFGLTISPDGRYAFFTHLVAMFNLPATIITGGWIHTNNLAIVDITNKKMINDVSLDYSEVYGAANPWSIDCTADGKFLCVAHAGSNQLSIIDLPQLLEKADTTISLAHSITLLNQTTIRNLIEVEGKTPRALTILGDNVYTAGYFSDNVEIFPISLSTSTSSGKISLGPDQALTDERMGEFNFYSGDRDHCTGKWQSCSSCHPFARSDALNWILASANNFTKNTKSMLYSWWTPPIGWSQKHENTYESIYFKYTQILDLGGENTAKNATINTIGEFFKLLKPMASPALVKGLLSESAKRGRELFYGDKADCKRCHPAPLYTDLKRHDTIAFDNDATTSWDTPGLIECWRSGPWNHIGSIDKFIDLMNNSLHPTTPTLLNLDQIKDLNEFVLSL